MGIDDVRHTECHVKDAQDLIDFTTRTAKKELLLLDTKLRVGKKLVEIAQETSGGEESGDENGEDGHEGNYDHLEYFRSNSKSSSSAYKTVIPVSPPPQPANATMTTTQTGGSNILLTQLSSVKKPAANDDYEIIGAPTTTTTTITATATAIDTKMSRKADDSYLGYGVLRRPIGLPLPPTPTTGMPLQLVKKSPSASDANKVVFLQESMTNNNNNSNNSNNNNNEVLLKNSAILLTTAASDANALCEKRIEMLASGDLVEDVDDVLGHRKFNGLDYAIVSKPKRV